MVLSRDPDDGGYTVVCPAMPGAITEADTRADALASAADVMALWLEIAAERGFQPLEETAALVGAKVTEVIADRDAEGWDRTVETASVTPAIRVAA